MKTTRIVKLAESVRFFTTQDEAWEFSKMTGEKKDFTILDYGKSGNRFYVKYKKEETI